MKPLVSILIPAYNAEEWIADTLKSAIAQTWDNKEIIVIDDGSKDGTLRVARQFESEKLRVVAQINQGAAAARNHAFSLSKGEYIQWLDADDLLAPDKISRQMALLANCRKRKPLLSSSWGRFLYLPSRAKFVPTSLWQDLQPVEWLLRKMGQNVYMQTATWLVSRELSEAAGKWNTALLGDDDGEYFCRVLMASDGVCFQSSAKVYYRAAGPGSLSHVGHSNRKIDAHWLSMQSHVRYLLSLEDSARVREACVNYLRASLIYLYPERSDIVQEAEIIAANLGSSLGEPKMSWKYTGIKTVFGWTAAKRTQLWLLRLKWSVQRAWDRIVFRLGNGDIQASLSE